MYLNIFRLNIETCINTVIDIAEKEKKKGRDLQPYVASMCNIIRKNLHELENRYDMQDYYIKKKIERYKTEDCLKRVPEIPIHERGKAYTGECVCGGTITAIRSTYNGHIHASCDKCGFRMFE